MFLSLTSTAFSSHCQLQILVVGGELLDSELIEANLKQSGYTIAAVVETESEAIAKAEELNPDVAVISLAGDQPLNRLALGMRIWEELHIPSLFYTSSSASSEQQTVRQQKLNFFQPIQTSDLARAIEKVSQLNQDLDDRIEWFSTVLRDMGDAVIVVDRQARVEFINLVGQVLIGWTLDEAKGKPIQDLIQFVNEVSNEPVAISAIAALQYGIVAHLPEQVRLIARDGSSVPVADSASPMRNQQGDIIGAVFLLRDVTRHRIAEERNSAIDRTRQLESQMDELRRLNQMKDDFLNTVSHELRTPLTSMKLAIQMLEITLEQLGLINSNCSDELRAKASRYFQILREQCQQEMNLINNLLDLQRLNSTVASLKITTIHLQQWLPQTISKFEEQLNNTGHQLTLSIESELPPLRSDRDHLERILTELLNNAWKYTPTGEAIGITAQLAPLRYVADIPSAQITVSNTGVNLSQDEISHLFDQFYRVARVDWRNQGGTGLGLALVQKLVEQIGGSIAVESQPGQLAFVIYIPFEGSAT